MKVIVRSLSENMIDHRDGRNALQIEVDGKDEFHVWDDEPEDSNLYRTFSPCFSIPRLMKLAHEAGKRGEEFIVEEEKVDEI
jgi:hypothetical protein